MPVGAALPVGAAGAAPAFLHGVVSGDPLPDGVLLRTRVTPTPDSIPGSGIGPDTEVDWVVAADKAFTNIVAQGSVTATAASDRTVKADIRGLAPATDHWFRFSAGGTDSPVARTRTTPAADAAVAGLRFGVASCSNWEAGHFSAYRHLATRGDLDAWLHLGDYIYEYGTRGKTVRPHAPAHEILTLADHRVRHAKHKTDPDLQALHAKAPVMAIWDDHEFANDAWSGGAESHTEGAEGTWAARQAAAEQACFEWMPVRPAPAGTTYRRLRFGRLGDGEVDDPDRTLTGRAQLGRLKAGLSASDTTWRPAGTSVMISPLVLGALPASLLKPLAELLDLPQEGLALNTDQWDGYTDDRPELLARLRTNAIGNTVFLTGDIHMAWADDVPVDAGTSPLSPSAATEFVVTSVTSDNLDDIVEVPEGTVSAVASALIRTTDRHVHRVDTDRYGHGVLDITAELAQTDSSVPSGRTDPAATSTWARSYRTHSGTQQVERSYDPVLSRSTDSPRGRFSANPDRGVIRQGQIPSPRRAV